MRSAARDNQGYSLNFAVAGSDDFLYTVSGYTAFKYAECLL